MFSKQKGWFVLFCLTAFSCYYEDIPRQPDLSICVDSDIAVIAESEGSSGCGNADGSIMASASGGTGDYSFSIDGGRTKQVSASFSNLEGGTYELIVFDGSSCSDSTKINVPVANSTFQANVEAVTPDSECTVDNGAIEVSSSGSTGTVSYTLGNETNSIGQFTGLAGGSYSITVSDASCTLKLSASVPSESSTSYAQDIVPILDAKCNFSTCHGSKGPQTNLTVYDIVKANASEIKLRTGNGNMPKQPKPGGSLTSEQIRLIACWVDDGAKNN